MSLQRQVHEGGSNSVGSYPYESPAHLQHGLVVLCRLLGSFR